MIIRTAVIADVPQMLLMGERFHVAAGYADIVSLDRESLAQTLYLGIEQQNQIYLVAESGHLLGMVGAILYPFYFNLNHLTCQELFWWTDEKQKGIGTKLFDAMKEEAKKRGAKSLTMIALDKLNPSGVGAFYKKRGLRASEHSYIGSL